LKGTETDIISFVSGKSVPIVSRQKGRNYAITSAYTQKSWILWNNARVDTAHILQGSEIMSPIDLSKIKSRPIVTKNPQLPVKIVAGKNIPFDNLKRKELKLSFHPDLHKLLREISKPHGGISKYIRELVRVDIHKLEYYIKLVAPKKKNSEYTLHITRGYYNELKRRADQAMFLNPSDYVRTLIYADMIWNERIDITLASELAGD